MSTKVSPFAVEFPTWYDDRAEMETTAKGYLPDVIVRLEDGGQYRLTFFDPVRLAQDLEDQAKWGQCYMAEAGLVVVTEVSRECVRHAVAGLWREGFFKSLRPAEIVTS